MKLTIITVCYNAESVIRKTVKSVLRQSYRDFEYLIIDGESCDKTVSIIKEYQDDKRISLYVEKDFGIYNAMNRGICRAKGDFIYFLNAGDTFFDKDTLNKVVPYLQKNDTIYYGNIRCTNPQGVNVVIDYSDDKTVAIDKFLATVVPCHQAVFAPKASLNNHFFKEKYKLRADYQWFCDCVLQGFLTHNIPVIIANYDINGESGSVSNIELMEQETRQIYKEFIEAKNASITNLIASMQEESEWKKLSDKHFKILKLMDNWLTLRQKDISLYKYFKEHNMTRIAIYGLGHIGIRLLKEVEKEGIVKYAIDKRRIETSVPVRTIDEKLEEVDVIVVTTVSDYEEVTALLNEKTKWGLIRFDEIIQYCLK